MNKAVHKIEIKEQKESILKKSEEDELEDHIIEFTNPIFGSYDQLQGH
jgi:hypothetical protein